MGSWGEQAQDEVRSLVERLQLEGQVYGQRFEDLPTADQKRLRSLAAGYADDGEDPFDAARAAVRTVLKAIP